MTIEESLSHPTVMERYTAATRRALQFAYQESLHRGAPAIAVVDMLAGLSVEEDTRAERVGLLKSNAFYIRCLVVLTALPSRAEHSIENSIGNADQVNFDAMDESWLNLDIEAKRALGFAVMEADRDREYWIDYDHLLRGILRFPNRSHFAVLKTEVNLDSTRAASRADRRQYPPARNAQHKGRQIFNPEASCAVDSADPQSRLLPLYLDRRHRADSLPAGQIEVAAWK